MGKIFFGIMSNFWNLFSLQIACHTTLQKALAKLDLASFDQPWEMYVIADAVKSYAVYSYKCRMTWIVLEFEQRWHMPFQDYQAKEGIVLKRISPTPKSDR